MAGYSASVLKQGCLLLLNAPPSFSWKPIQRRLADFKIRAVKAELEVLWLVVEYTKS